MQLKNYQQKSLSDISCFLKKWSDDKSHNASVAFSNFWQEQGIPVGTAAAVPPYNDTLGNNTVPQLCVKIPTGGGKTFVAASSLRTIFNHLKSRRAKAVVWLVPSDSILRQTYTALMDSEHPYRKKIDADFGNRVSVYGKNELLEGQSFTSSDIDNQLSIFVLSFDSLRTSTKDSRLVYRDNGNLLSFKRRLDQQPAANESAETSLIRVIQYLNPVVIIDESHHATSNLSVDMLKAVNPAFILELTATPKQSSNVITYVDSYQLKQQHMVKLPVIVYNRQSKSDVISSAIAIRKRLENSAKQELPARYIRPIVLFQAEPRNKEDSVTFKNVKQELLDYGIPEDQIALKTANMDDLGDIDLSKPNCKIRYIITVNALKEGWDCPFAYILATIANKSSTVDVEQILGRVLRLPNAHESNEPLLNMAYVLTSSNDFAKTLDKVVDGLNYAGFSSKDYRAVNLNAASASGDSVSNTEPSQSGTGVISGHVDSSDTNAVSSSVSDTESRQFMVASDSDGSSNTDGNNTAPNTIEPMSHEDNSNNSLTTDMDTLLDQAKQENKNFESDMRQNKATESSLPKDLAEQVPIFEIQPMFVSDANKTRIPQFMIKSEATLFADETIRKLQLSDLTESFDLASADLKFNWSTPNPEIAKVDVNVSSEVKQEQVRNLSDAEKELFDNISSETQLSYTIDIAVKKIDQIDAVDNISARNYVDRLMNLFTEDQKKMAIKNPFEFAEQVKNKVENLLSDERQHEFNEEIYKGNITAKEQYHFPHEMSLSTAINSLERTLYTGEEQVNGFERKMMDTLANSDNILWWHRNPARPKYGFCINGPFNHFPDFIAKTKTGLILVIETKGDHLATNGQSRAELGYEWQSLAGLQRYRYFLVFQTIETEHTVNYDHFKNILSSL